MKKVVTHKFSTAIANNTTSTYTILSGKAGKNRRVVSVTGDIDSDIYLRCWVDNEQVIDIECDLLTTSKPWVDVDIPLADGEQFEIGFYNEAAGNVTPSVAVAYEES